MLLAYFSLMNSIYLHIAFNVRVERKGLPSRLSLPLICGWRGGGWVDGCNEGAVLPLLLLTFVRCGFYRIMELGWAEGMRMLLGITHMLRLQAIWYYHLKAAADLPPTYYT